MKMTEPQLKQKVKKIAADKNCDPQEVYKKLFFERFLVRLVNSEVSDKFLFKGGNLLGYCIELGRQTRDLDFLATQIQTKKESIHKAFERICAIEADDGFSLQLDKLKPITQNLMPYRGFRVTLLMKVKEGKMEERLQIDVSIEDIVEGENRMITLTNYQGEPLFENSISLKAYSMEAVFSEKLETVLSRAESNSRMKDFHDLIIMIREPNLLDREALTASIKKTFEHRQTSWKFPIQFSDEAYQTLQKYWIQHLKNIGDLAKKKQLPEHIKQVILEINSYLNRNGIT